MVNLAKLASIEPRLVSVAREYPASVSRMKLSKTQLNVLKAINRGEKVIPSDIVTRCRLSSAWASTTLRRLHERAYLSRRSEPSETGGITFVYTRL